MTTCKICKRDWTKPENAPTLEGQTFLSSDVRCPCGQLYSVDNRSKEFVMIKEESK